MTKQVASRYECKYCHQAFERETNYMRHHCDLMKRHEEIVTPVGQAAYQHYSDWMEVYKRMAPPLDTFLSSRFYKSFIKFAKYVIELNIPETSVFIRLMHERDISPTIWTNDQVYALYLEYLDHKLTPMGQAKITVNTLFKLADERGCNIEEFFTTYHPNEVLQLLRERRLSPWILLFSTQFQIMLKRCSEEQRALFEALIRPHYWRYKFEKNPKYVELMKKYVEELNI
ncbi:hypothetical protein LCGC14_0890170 [marine sediment metagenome]|uniref:C2H2-type domain-containing protein n=1 Tax=marine sediment metagenome TaxID=412755 RepID=A0A0F9P4B1_9ZZZZ